MKPPTPTLYARPPLRGSQALHLMEVVEGRLRRFDEASRAMGPFRDDRPAGWLRADAQARNASGSLALAGSAMDLDRVRGLQGGPRRQDNEALAPADIEIINHLRFYERLRSIRPPRSADDIAAVHEALFRGTMDDAGQLREGPSPPEAPGPAQGPAAGTAAGETQNALDRFAESDAHPAVQAAVLSHDLHRIRPFRDGNARVARALSHIILESAGHHGVRFALVDDRLARHAARFHAIRDQARDGRDAVPWGRFLTHQFAAAFEEARGRMDFASKMPRHLNQRQWLVADWFSHRDQRFPGRRARFRDVEADFGWVATRTLKRDLARLRDEGILVMEGHLKGTDYHLAGPYTITPST